MITHIHNPTATEALLNLIWGGYATQHTCGKGLGHFHLAPLVLPKITR